MFTLFNVGQRRLKAVYPQTSIITPLKSEYVYMLNYSDKSKVGNVFYYRFFSTV